MNNLPTIVPATECMLGPYEADAVVLREKNRDEKLFEFQIPGLGEFLSDDSERFDLAYAAYASACLDHAATATQNALMRFHVPGAADREAMLRNALDRLYAARSGWSKKRDRIVGTLRRRKRSQEDAIALWRADLLIASLEDVLAVAEDIPGAS